MFHQKCLTLPHTQGCPFPFKTPPEKSCFQKMRGILAEGWGGFRGCLSLLPHFEGAFPRGFTECLGSLSVLLGALAQAVGMESTRPVQNVPVTFPDFALAPAHTVQALGPDRGQGRGRTFLRELARAQRPDRASGSRAKPNFAVGIGATPQTLAPDGAKGGHWDTSPLTRSTRSSRSEPRQHVMRSPRRTGLGKRPDFTPAHHVAGLTSMSGGPPCLLRTMDLMR